MARTNTIRAAVDAVLPVDVAQATITEKKRVVRRKKIATNPDDRVYIFSKEGGLVLDRNAAGECVPAGWIEPKVFAESIQIDRPIETGIMPRNLIYFSKKVASTLETNTAAIYEFEPSVLTISYRDSNLNVKLYKLSMPYIQFYCKLKSVNGKNTVGQDAYLTCTKKPLTSLLDPVFELPLNNIGSRNSQRTQGHICWGYDNSTKIDDSIPLLVLGRKRASQFFNSVFNNHLPPSIPKEFTSASTVEAADAFFYNVWQKKTLEDPKFIFNVDFVPIGTAQSILDLINRSYL